MVRCALRDSKEQVRMNLGMKFIRINLGIKLFFACGLAYTNTSILLGPVIWVWSSISGPQTELNYCIEL